MSEKLKPCPFCGGPPVVWVLRAFHPYGYLPPSEIDPAEGTSAEAVVGCHECGARGPAAEEHIYLAFEYKDLEQQAVRNWQDRDERHADLYQSNGEIGNNEYPRTGEVSGA